MLCLVSNETQNETNEIQTKMNSTEYVMSLEQALQIAAERFAQEKAIRRVTLQMTWGLIDIDRTMTIKPHQPSW